MAAPYPINDNKHGVGIGGWENNRHIIAEISDEMLVIPDCYEHQTDFAALGVQAGSSQDP